MAEAGTPATEPENAEAERSQLGGQVRTVTVEQLTGELKPVVRRGLPVTPDTAGQVLPNLRCVIARAIHPGDRLSRVTALDTLLRQILADLGEADFGQAGRLLFALEPRVKSTKLTYRRGEAARVMGYDDDHFRKRIEPKLLNVVALQLHELTLKHQPRAPKGRIPPALSGSTPGLTDADLTAHEEAVSRIWSHVYGLRAELIAVQRRQRSDLPEPEWQHHAETGLWQLARLLTVLDKYLDQFGERIMHGELEYAAESVTRLAGWRGPLNDKEAQFLRYTLARAVADDRQAFLRRLRQSKSGREMLEKWQGCVTE